MILDEASFGRLADEILERIADAVDAELGDTWDVEFEGAIVSIVSPQGGQYILNKHAPNREIWLSSPRSGAWHFAWDGQVWRSTRGAETLEAVLSDELGQASGRPFSFG